MQIEPLDRKKWKTRVELANAIFEYREIWHNRQRRHSQLGMLTPIEFERERIGYLNGETVRIDAAARLPAR